MIMDVCRECILLFVKPEAGKKGSVSLKKVKENKTEIKELSCGCCDTCRHKHTPRDDKEIKQLKNRLSRVSGLKKRKPEI